MTDNLIFEDMQKATNLQKSTQSELTDWNPPLHAHALIGRDEDIAAIRNKLLVEDLHLLTITGMGGVGKTSVAIEVMKQLEPYFSMSLFLDIVQISLEESILSLIARSMGIMESDSGSLFNQLSHSFGIRRILLLIDNCEYKLDNLKDLCVLLEVCPNLKVILISRVTIKTRFGKVYHLAPLSIPSPEQLDNSNALLQLPSVRLFMTRMKGSMGEYDFSAEDIMKIGRLCSLLDGIPLALEIVAAKASQLGGLSECLHMQLDSIMDDSLDVPERQHCLRDSIEWSYSLLSHYEKELLCRFSVFPGFWTLQQAVGICSGYGIEGKDILMLTNSLIANSLVVEKRDSSGETRYCLLDNIRQCAGQHLKDYNMELTIKRRHRDWFLALAEQMEPDSWNSNMIGWLKLIKVDFYNYRAALEFCATNEEEAPAGVRIWAAYCRYFTVKCYVPYEVSLAKKLLKLSKEKSRARLTTLLKVAQSLHLQGKIEEAKIFNHELLALSIELGEDTYHALALGHVALYHDRNGYFDLAEAMHIHKIDILRSAHEDSITGLYTGLFATGEFYRFHGDYSTALAYSQEAIVLARKQGDPNAMAYYSASQGIMLLGVGRVTEAEKMLSECIELCCAMDYVDLAPRCLDFMGHVAWKKNKRQQAVNLFGLASAIRTWTGYLIWLPDPEYEAIMKQIGDEVQQISKSLLSYYSSKDIMSLVGVVARNSSMVTNTDLNPHPNGGTGLSQRELEIAAYIARGFTNQKIADTLFLSKRTVDAHIRNILFKLDLANRSQISAWYTESQKQ